MEALFIIFFPYSSSVFAYFSFLLQRERKAAEPLWFLTYFTLVLCPGSALLSPGAFSSAGLFLILLPLPWKIYLHVLPNTPFVCLCHTSATAPLVAFMYFSFAVPQNASQAVAGFAVTKHITHTVWLAGLFWSTCVWFQGKGILILSHASASKCSRPVLWQQCSAISENPHSALQMQHLMTMRVTFYLSWHPPNESFLIAKQIFPLTLRKLPCLLTPNLPSVPELKSISIPLFYGNQ